MHSADRLAPVWVLVRSPIVGLSLRQRLAEAGPFAAVRFAPLAALVQQLGAAGAARGGRRPLTPVALRTAARVALGEVPGLLAPVAGHGATEASLAATYRDLRRASAVELERLALASPRAGDVVALAAAMRQHLESDYYDDVDLLRAATDHVGAADEADLAEVGSVVVYLPDPLGPAETQLLVVLARRLRVVVLAGEANDALADREAARYLAALADGFGTVGCGIAGTGGAAAPAGAGATELGAPTVGSGADGARFVEFFSAPDDDVEVRQVVRRLVAYAEDGGRLGECVVTFPDGGRSAEMHRRIAEQLGAAGIPFSGSARQLLGDTPPARLLTGLVQLAIPVPPGQELDRGQVVEWIASGPIRCDKGLARTLASVAREGGVPVGAWDRCSRSAGIFSGIAQWRDRLRTRHDPPAAGRDGRAGARSAGRVRSARLRRTAARTRVGGVAGRELGWAARMGH